MYIPKLNFGSIEEIFDGAIEEGNFMMGYKKIIIAAELDASDHEEGMEIVRKATNSTKALYRFREEIKEIESKKVVEAKRQHKALTEDGVALDQSKIDDLDKEIRKVEHKAVVAAYELQMLREPLDDFLALADIPVRDKYNRGRKKKAVI